MNVRAILSGVLTIVITFFVTTVVSAHNMVPRVEISMERLNPGGVVDVRGVSFGMEESVTLSLIGSGVDIFLGQMISDAEGEFTHITVLPADLVEGTYYFRAVTSHHFVLSPAFTVQGPPILDPEGGHGDGDREEEDPLLAPMPTFAPGVVPGGVVPPTAQPTSATTASSSSRGSAAILLIVLVVGILVVLGLKRKNT
ncbi:MAG: hypothetical protein L0287_33810 [Anaerolineae bacterium]|nr:hypothetical protein [Anaerolineae bacterium]